MIKNIKLAIGFGALMWAAIFAAVSILIFIPFIKDYLPLRSIINWVIVGLLAYFLAKIYFRKSPGETRDGIVLGFFWLAVGIFLDLLITVPLFIKKQVAEIYGLEPSWGEAAGVFFRDWRLLTGFLIIVIFTVIAAITTKNKQNINSTGNTHFQPPEQIFNKPQPDNNTQNVNSQGQEKTSSDNINKS